MNKFIAALFIAGSVFTASAETITAHYYGSGIDLSQKHNPCTGDTDGGVEVIVTTRISEVSNNSNRTVVDRTYSLPDGKTLKTDREIIDAPKYAVLSKLFPHQYSIKRR